MTYMIRIVRYDSYRNCWRTCWLITIYKAAQRRLPGSHQPALHITPISLHGCCAAELWPSHTLMHTPRPLQLCGHSDSGCTMHLSWPHMLIALRPCASAMGLRTHNRTMFGYQVSASQSSQRDDPQPASRRPFC